MGDVGKAMNDPVYFPRHLIAAGAATFGALLTLGVHILGQRFGMNLGDLWASDASRLVPARAAIAWWLIAAVAFIGGYATASLMDSAVAGGIPRRMRYVLMAAGVLLLAAAGQIASAPSAIPTTTGVLAAIAALMLGAVMAFCGAHFALRR